jgi:hypothetical protein
MPAINTYCAHGGVRKHVKLISETVYDMTLLSVLNTVTVKLEDVLWSRADYVCWYYKRVKKNHSQVVQQIARSFTTQGIKMNVYLTFSFLPLSFCHKMNQFLSLEFHI